MNHEASAAPPALSPGARYTILAVAFLGWLFAGVQMSITPLLSRSASRTFLGEGAPEGQVSEWFAWFNAAFMLGAACGGLLFGWYGDRAGRAKAMAGSILCYSLASGLSWFAADSPQYLALRFIGALGVGGMWPNGIALASEAWPGVARPLLAGLIGTAANVGQVFLGLLTLTWPITAASWRWPLLVGAAPALLGIFSLFAVAESPRWLAQRSQPRIQKSTPILDVFGPGLWQVTLTGILLGAIPLFGGWGNGNWLVPWADKVGGLTDPKLKSWALINRTLGGSVSSLLGGWVASRLGRKRSYFLFSIASLAVSAYIFRALDPLHPWFSWATIALGVVSGFYFGWLPLCLPEMFPTRVRATGGGVTFNAGRIATALGLFGAGSLLRLYDGDYARVGALTSLVYALGMVVIWFVPQPRTDELRDE